MKKRMIGTMASLTFIILLAGCGANPKEVNLTNPGASEYQENKQSQGIAVHQLNYETVTDNHTPKEVRRIVENKHEKRGFISYPTEEGLYIGVFAGQKSSGGYDINIFSVEDNEGKTNVYVEETAPTEGMITTQALTYPYVVIKVTGVTSDVRVTIPTKNMSGEKLRKIELIEEQKTVLSDVWFFLISYKTLYDR